jgi:hypothetical protein
VVIERRVPWLGATGFVGVSLKKDARQKRYQAIVKIKRGGSRFLGLFHSAEEAARAYDAQLVQLQGCNARTNASLGLFGRKS